MCIHFFETPCIYAFENILLIKLILSFTSLNAHYTHFCKGGVIGWWVGVCNWLVCVCVCARNYKCLGGCGYKWLICH